MGKIQKEWARKRRIELTMLLGGTCRECGTEDNLTFDCVIPQGDKHHKMDTSARMSFYNFQFRLGNLQVLCDKCNSRKGATEIEETENVWEKLIEICESH